MKRFRILFLFCFFSVTRLYVNTVLFDIMWLLYSQLKSINILRKRSLCCLF